MAFNSADKEGFALALCSPFCSPFCTLSLQLHSSASQLRKPWSGLQRQLSAAGLRLRWDRQEVL